MSDIYTNGHMSISSFKVYKRTASGGWVRADSLRYNEKYRFRFRCINRARPSPPVHFDQVRVWTHSNSHTRYYESSSYSGTYTTKFQSKLWDTTLLRSGKGMTIYAYFKWRGPDGKQVDTLPLMIGMTARELRYLPNGPVVPLLANVQ